MLQRRKANRHSHKTLQMPRKRNTNTCSTANSNTISEMCVKLDWQCAGFKAGYDTVALRLNHKAKTSRPKLSKQSQGRRKKASWPRPRTVLTSPVVVKANITIIYIRNTHCHRLGGRQWKRPGCDHSCECPIHYDDTEQLMSHSQCTQRRPAILYRLPVRTG